MTHCGDQQILNSPSLLCIELPKSLSIDVVRLQKLGHVIRIDRSYQFS